MKNLMVLGLVLASAPCFAESSGQPTSVDGVIIRRGGNDYKIISSEKSRRLRIYLQGKKTKLPNELVVQIKKDGKILDRLHATLDKDSLERGHYTGIVPARISASGGLSFDIEISPNKEK